MLSYLDAITRVKPKRTSAPKNSRIFQRDDFKAAAMSERRGLPDRAKLFLVALADILDDKGRGRLTDEGLAERIGGEASSVPGLFGCAEKLRYLAPVGRKRGGERDYQTHSRWFDSATDENPEETDASSPTSDDAEHSDAETRADPANSVSGPNSREKNIDKETPDRAASRPRVRDSLTRGRQTSESSSQNSLSDLLDGYGAEHFSAEVVEAAKSLNDPGGLPRYRNIFEFEAQRDSTLWAEALAKVAERQAEKVIDAPSARCYLERTVKGLVKAKKQAASDRERIRRTDAESGRARRAADQERVRRTDERIKDAAREHQQAPRREVSEDELDALMRDDPFAEDARPVSDDAPKPPDKGIPVPQDEDASEPDSQAAAPEQFAPDKVMPPDGAVYHKAVQEAAAALRIDHDIDKLQSVFDGGCKGRVEVFNLGVQTILRSEKPVKSPISFILQLALEHAAKDATWLENRAKGLTTAQCTALTVAWEEYLERVKAEKNGDGETWRYPGADIASILSGIVDRAETAADGNEDPLDLREFQGLTIPEESDTKGWIALQEEYTRLSSTLDRLDNETRAHLEARAEAFASTKSRIGKASNRWKNWMRRALYHGVATAEKFADRAENIAAARIAVNTEFGNESEYGDYDMEREDWLD